MAGRHPGQTGHGQRIPLVEIDELDDDLQEMVRRWQALGGDINFIRTFAHSPGVLKRFIAFYSPLVRKGRVPHRIKELVRIRLANFNDCHY